MADAAFVEVVVCHAIRGNEITVHVPQRAKFRHVKKAVSRLLEPGDDLDFLESGVLLHKTTGVYTAYKDDSQLNTVRRVLVCSSTVGEIGSAEIRLDEEEVSEEEEAEEEVVAAEPPLPLDPELLKYRPPPRPARKEIPVLQRSAREVLTEKAKKQLHVKSIQKDVRVVVADSFFSDNAEGEEVALAKGQRGVVLQVDDPQHGFALIAFTAHDQAQWVFQNNFHKLGIAEEVKEGTHVIVREDFLSDSEAAVDLQAGQRGRVTGIDGDGDATVAFDAHDQEQWVSKRHFDMLRVVSGAESVPLKRDEAFELQSELHRRFLEPKFQQDLRALQQQLATGQISQFGFGKARQPLFMQVQGIVLPKYGFEASGPGIIRMMSAMGPFIKDPEIADLSRRTNVLLGLEMPADKWKQITEECGAVAKCKEPDPLELMPPVASKQAMVASMGPARRSDGKAVEVKAQPAPSTPPEFNCWPSSEPPPVRVFIVGSWDSFKPAAMQWEGRAYRHRVEVGSSGCETFQLRRGRSVAQTIYPSAADASAFDAQDSWALQGPDDRGQQKYWKIGKHPQDKAEVGDAFLVLVSLDVHGNVAYVCWKRS